MWIDLDEMALHGQADVLAVEACPPIQAGAGRVVLATMTRMNSALVEVGLQGVSEPLRLTDNHPLFSATRHDWIPAAGLRIGEELVTRSGTIQVASIDTLLGTHHVFNIEVEREHCYYTTAAEVLSHNSCTGGAEKAPHANRVDERPATLYEKYDKDGNFQKHGITKHEDPSKRYTKAEIDGGEVRPVERAPRSEMIKKERYRVETNPGPDNREPWAGKRKGQQ